MGEWALLLAYWPGRQPKPIGILLRDAMDGFHVKVRNDWSMFVGDQDEIELWREIGEDLAQKGRALGAASLLEWMENTASHALQIGPRQCVEVSDPQKRIEDLYRQYVALTGRVETAKQQTQHRYRVHIAIAAALVLTAILVARRMDLAKKIQTTQSTAISTPDIADIGLPEFSSRQFQLQINMRRKAMHRRTRGHQAAPHHKQFSYKVSALTLPAMQVIEMHPPPSVPITEMNYPEPLPFDVPALPPFQIRHTRFVRLLLMVASPLRKLLASPHANDETVLN